MGEGARSLRPERLAVIDGIKFTVDDVIALARFSEGSKRNGQDGYLVRCPSHDEQEASCSVTPGENGFAKVKCFVGCDNDEVHRAFVEAGVANRWEAPRTDREIKGRVIGQTDWIIRDYDGNAVALHRRYDFEPVPPATKGSKDFRTLKPNGKPFDKAKGEKADLMNCLYGMERLRLYPDRNVVICEGEKAADAARLIGFSCVLSTVGASVAPGPEVLRRLKDRSVVFWRDADDAGEKQARIFRDKLRGVVEAFAVFVNPGARHGSKDDAAEYAGDINADFEALEWEKRKPWPDDVTPIYEALDEAQATYDRYVSGDTSGVVPTGYVTLDRAIRGGLEPGEVYLLGAPTGGGKTTIMQDFAERIAQRGPVLFVTPEMTVVSMALRALIKEAQTPMDFAAPWRDDEDMRDDAVVAMLAAYSRIAERKLPVLIYDEPDVSMEKIEDRARRIQKLQAVVIDYAQQVAGMDARTPRYLQVGDVATRASVIAKSLGVPVLLASQVNRVVEGTGKAKRKATYSFRETAMMEHKASVVLIFDRELNEETGELVEPLADESLSAMLSCTKNRHGRIFDPVLMRWDAARFRVWEVPVAERPRGPERAPRAARNPADGEVVTSDTPARALPPGRSAASLGRSTLYEDQD